MKKRKILSVLLAAAMTCAMCLSAGAADVSPCIYDLEKESTHKTVSVGDYSYDCYTTLYYGTSSKGCLWAVEKNKKDAQAVLKTYLCENGKVVEESDWATSTAYIHFLDTKKHAVSGDIEVKGSYMFYLPNGDYLSGSAPVVSYSTSRSAVARVPVTSYPTNAKGETYGSYLDEDTVGQAPDLIAAMGENDVEGYIRLNDIAPELRSYEEVRQYQAQVDANPVIPLYDLDGKVIGSFVRGTTQDHSNPDPVVVQKLDEMTGGKSADFLPSAQPIPVKHDYPTNANGESYGSYGDRDKYGYPPQLIAVIGDNDRSGYVRLSDFRAANRPANVVWDVYDLKGNVIDTFSH